MDNGDQLSSMVQALYGQAANTETIILEQSSSGLLGYAITAIAAFAGAGVAAWIHYSATRHSLKGSIIVEARKTWADGLRDDIATFMTESLAIVDRNNPHRATAAHAAAERILLRLTPEKHRETRSDRLSDRHEPLETAVREAARRCLSIERELDKGTDEGFKNALQEFEQFVPYAQSVRERGRDILYGTWRQIREEIEKETKPFSKLIIWFKEEFGRDGETRAKPNN